MNREEFFAFPDRIIVPVLVKEMNFTFHVRSISAAEKAKWEMEIIRINNSAKSGNAVELTKDRMLTAHERLVELATCNEDGSAFFKPGDAPEIGKKNSNVVATLYEAAAKLSGITKEDIEDLGKNSLSASEEVLSA